MPEQLSFFESGQILRDRGIKQALDHAEAVQDDWQEKALSFLGEWVSPGWHHQFAIEEIREASKGIVPDAPCLRAWGAVARVAARRGWIRKVGYIQVRNPAAHCANATLWESCL